MKTIDLSSELLTLNELLQLASEDDIILKTPEGQEFMLAQLEDFEQEVELVRQNPELMQLLKERSKEPATYTLDQIREQLNLK